MEGNGQPLENSSVEHLQASGRLESRQLTFGRAAVVPRIISAISVGLAIFAAFLLIALRLVHWLQPNLLPWTLKSAIPLILIGIAFAWFQFSLPRTLGQRLSGLGVAAAFVLWGIEQFVPNQRIVSAIDDVVVFLFVLDLGIVICGSLREQNRKKPLRP